MRNFAQVGGQLAAGNDSAVGLMKDAFKLARSYAAEQMCIVQFGSDHVIAADDSECHRVDCG